MSSHISSCHHSRLKWGIMKRKKKIMTMKRGGDDEDDTHVAYPLLRTKMMMHTAEPKLKVEEALSATIVNRQYA
eukprot:scaffold3955_cov84-Skeletonema_marinoi.AAC.3